MVNKYLAKFSMDYCDEYDVQGFSIWSEEDYEKYKEFYKSSHLNKEVEIYFGTNEYLEDTIKGFLNNIYVKENCSNISAIEIEFGNEYGLLTPSEVLSILEERLEFIEV